MRKRLTLNRAWELCLKQWEPMVKAYYKGVSSIVALKSKHFPECEFDPDDIDQLCFFCEYAARHRGNCEDCPGKKVDPKFHCTNTAYEFSTKPLEFLMKICEMNGKRKS